MYHGKRQSIRIEQCESMTSFLSVNADADARWEHSLTDVQELNPENNIFTYFLPQGKWLGPPNTGLDVSSVFCDILNCPHPWNISEMSLRLIKFRVKISSYNFRHEIIPYWWEIRISSSELFFLLCLLTIQCKNMYIDVYRWNKQKMIVQPSTLLTCKRMNLQQNIFATKICWSQNINGYNCHGNWIPSDTQIILWC